jgi:hypothetical protein
LPETTDSLQQWIKENDDFDDDEQIEKKIDDYSIIIENAIDNIEENNELNETLFNDVVSIIERKDIKIEGKFTDDEIRNYFSFLCKEKSFDNKPFLSEDAVNEIFKNGLMIPAVPLENKFKLNCDPRFPKKIIEFAIYTFYVNNSIKRTDKIKYLKFFGSYLEDFSSVLASNKMASNVASNISGEKSPKMKFDLKKYLPGGLR